MAKNTRAAKRWRSERSCLNRVAGLIRWISVVSVEVCAPVCVRACVFVCVWMGACMHALTFTVHDYLALRAQLKGCRWCCRKKYTLIAGGTNFNRTSLFGPADSRTNADTV